MLPSCRFIQSTSYGNNYYDSNTYYYDSSLRYPSCLFGKLFFVIIENSLYFLS